MSEKNIIDTAINNLLQDRELRGGSTNWANWISKLTLFTCLLCTQQHGKIVDISMLKNKTKVNAHKNCECEYVSMRTKQVGAATDLSMEGADSYLFYSGRLPDYYVSFEAAEDAGWRSKKENLNKVLPGTMIGGAVYKNKDGKLPQSPGRAWYEADINYDGGYRNRQRILYSSDGLIFISYDHYQTFYEITD
jgi:hypothetical protein